MDEDDGVGITMLITKPKLKSIGFCSSASSLIFKDFKEAKPQFSFNLNEKVEPQKEKIQIPLNVNHNKSRPNEAIALKRPREAETNSTEEKTDIVVVKKSKIDYEPMDDIPPSKPKKFTINLKDLIQNLKLNIKFNFLKV